MRFWEQKFYRFPSLRGNTVNICHFKIFMRLLTCLIGEKMSNRLGVESVELSFETKMELRLERPDIKGLEY